MGIILSALAGAGDSGAQSIDQNIKHQQQLDLDAARSDLEQKKALAILAATKQAQIDTGNQLRTEQAGRLASAKDDVIQQQMGQKYAPSDAAVAAADAGQTGAPLTPEQRAAIQQSKDIDLKSLASDPHSYIAAAMKTGDIDPKTVAELAQQADALKRQLASQEAQFAHADKAQREQFAHADASQARAQAFQAGESQKTRESITARLTSPETVTQEQKDLWLHQYIAANGAVPRSAPGWVRNNIGTWAAEKGITPQDLSSGMAQTKFDAAAAVTSGHRAGSMAGVEAAMPALADNAVSLSNKLGQGKFVPLNRLAQMADDAISDPDLAAFKVAHQALASEYQQVIARGGTNVTALKEAMHVLDSAKSPQAYAAAVNQVKNEVAINVNAMRSVRNNMGTGNHGAATVANPVVPSGSNLTYDPATGSFH